VDEIEIGERPPERRRLTGGWFGTLLTALLVLFALALGALVVAGRDLAAPPVPIALGTAVLPYLFLALGVLTCVVWILVPDRWLLPVIVGGLLVSAGVLWGPGWAPQPEVAEGTELRVLTWNVQRLWGETKDGADALACVAAVVREAHPDVLALLEVSADDTGRLSKELGLQCVHHPYQAGGDATQGGLASCSAGDRWRLREGEGQRFVDDEDWFYVFSEFVSAGRVVNLLAVHLYPYGFDLARRITSGPPGQEELLALGAKVSAVARGQSDQSAALLDRVVKLQDATVIAGDFNSTRDAALHVAMREHLTDVWEQAGFGFGGTVHLFRYLPLRVDHVYTSPELAVRDASVVEAGCSDHLPVVADLVLRDAEPR
jgi:endonuclease/exonuclease/phosphatase family metal-dependent hydrolase